MEKEKLHFFHIGKTGGGALRTALHPFANSGKFHLYLHGHATCLRDVPEGEKIFFFVREPASRFVSAFYSRLRKGKPKNSRDWSEAEKESFSHFQKANDLAEALTSSDALKQQRAVQAMSNIGHVNMPFLRWFESLEYFISRKKDILFIGFQERLNIDFERLKKLLCIPREASLTDDEVMMHKTSAELDTRLSALGVRNILMHYQQDLIFYSYCLNFAMQINNQLSRNATQTYECKAEEQPLSIEKQQPAHYFRQKLSTLLSR